MKQQKSKLWVLRKYRKLWALLNYITLVYDPDFWAIEPPKPKARTSNRVAADIKQPDNLVHTRNGSQIMREDSETNTIEFEQVKSAAKRSTALSDEDFNQLMLQGLDITGEKSIAKASEIKILWAKQMSNSEIVKHFNGKRGYSERTIKSYTAAFSKSVQIGAEIL